MHTKLYLRNLLSSPRVADRKTGAFVLEDRDGPSDGTLASWRPARPMAEKVSRAPLNDLGELICGSVADALRDFVSLSLHDCIIVEIMIA